MTIPGTRHIATVGEISIANSGELFCFGIKETIPDTYLTDFIDSLNEQLPKYVFSRRMLSHHAERLARGQTSRTPLEKAREFLQKTAADRTFDSGELGEFLLYLFASEVKGAFKVATKIQARGSVRMPIPGRDNSFVMRSGNGDVYMLVGEAKTMPSSNDGLKKAQEDLNAFWGTRGISHEINLASTHIRDEMTPENADLFEAYFIDDNPAHAELRYKNIVFVGYSLNAVKKLRERVITEEEFKVEASENLRRTFLNQVDLVNACPHGAIFCFMPFESINSARDEFARINGLTV